MIHDLLHQWPLELVTFWLFPLFFAYKFVELGRLGLSGRGLPITSSRNRWIGAANRLFSVLLVMAGITICGGFAYWLIVAIFRRWFSG